jgi:hypothetical protein
MEFLYILGAMFTAGGAIYALKDHEDTWKNLGIFIVVMLFWPFVLGFAMAAITDQPKEGDDDD